MKVRLTQKLGRKILDVVDAGLVSGLGDPEPGRTCVEGAVCIALGLPHSDDPECVAVSLRRFKIRLNDSDWSSDAARAAGLRKLAVAQVGSLGKLDDAEFVRRLAEATIREIVPAALRAAGLEVVAKRCEEEGTGTAARAAAAYADAYARDRILTLAADIGLRILREMAAPGVVLLDKLIEGELK